MIDEVGDSPANRTAGEMFVVPVHREFDNAGRTEPIEHVHLAAGFCLIYRLVTHVELVGSKRLNRLLLLGDEMPVERL